jgi:tetratricopeptide (TPR) repeat protein
LAKAISLLPGQAAPWLELGRVLSLAHDDRGALEAVEWAAHLAPSNPAVQAELKLLRAATPAGAAPRQPAIGAVTDTPVDHLKFAAELSTERDYEGAIGELLRVLALQPANQAGRGKLAAAYALLGQQDRAVLEYHKLLVAFPDDAGARIALSRILLAQGKTQEAKHQLQQALAYDPHSLEARVLLKKAGQPPQRP